MKLMSRKKCIARKILIIVLIALSLTFAISQYYSVYAEPTKVEEENMPDEGGGIMGSLLKQIIQLIDAVGDIIMGALNKFMLGADSFSSAMLSVEDENLDPNSGSWLTTDLGEVDFEYGPGTINTAEFLPWVNNEYDVPNFLYSPEAIFSNNIAALDVNFLNPNKYTAVSESKAAQEASVSAAGTDGLRKVISDWYISFRNIAIVGLLSVLIYLGIRIVISSTAVEKAKYKENLQNWVVALCLVFFIHFIMSGLLMITDKFNNLFENTANNGIVVQSTKPNDGGNIKFKTNLIGFIRFNVQSASAYDTVAYSILYLILIVYTCRFTFMYFKRFLYMAFLTMIAPLVALTYPLDKMGDSKAQAFNAWFKEYVTHLILQPVHLILYVAFVSSAMDLVKNNILYGIVAIGFLIPAEKLIKEMFNIGNGAKTAGGLGTFAGGMFAKNLLDKGVAKIGKGGKSGDGSNKSGSSGNNDESNNKIRTQDRDFAQSFADDGGNQNNPQLNGGQDDNGDQQDDETQRMMNDRQVWQDMANDPNEIEQVRNDAQREADQIDQNMQGREPGNVPTIRQQNNNSTPKEQDKWVRKFGKKMGIKGAKKIGKTAFKGAKALGARVPRAIGATAGGVAGLAMGAATGDFSKSLQYMGLGAMTGNTIGKAGADLLKRGIDSAVDGMKGFGRSLVYEKDKAQYGIAYAAEQAEMKQNEKARKEFMKNKEEKEKYEEMAGRISRATQQDVNAKDLMSAAFDYKLAGITDEKQIENGLKMEAKYGKDNKNIHENMIDIVNMSSSYGKDYVLDDKKRSSMQDTIKSKVKGAKNQDKVWDLYTEALGFDSNSLGDKYKMQR